MLEIERLLCWMIVIAASQRLSVSMRQNESRSIACSKAILRAHGDWVQEFLPDEYKQVHS